MYYGDELIFEYNIFLKKNCIFLYSVFDNTYVIQ